MLKKNQVTFQELPNEYVIMNKEKILKKTVEAWVLYRARFSLSPKPEQSDAEFEKAWKTLQSSIHEQLYQSMLNRLYDDVVLFLTNMHKNAEELHEKGLFSGEPQDLFNLLFPIEKYINTLKTGNVGLEPEKPKSNLILPEDM